EPMFDYGRTPAGWQMCGQEWTSAEATNEEVKMRMFSDLRLGIEGNRVRARHTMSEGERRFVALGWSDDLEGPTDAVDARARMRATSHFWRDWLAGGRSPDHRSRPHLPRAA